MKLSVGSNKEEMLLI